MATNPQYAATPGRNTITFINTEANTASDGTGTTKELVAGTAAGRRIRRVACSRAAAANRVHFYISLDSGTTKRFLVDVLMPAATPSATVRHSYVEVPELVGLILAGTGHRLYAATHLGQDLNIDAEYADL
jgi:hypothetical protein